MHAQCLAPILPTVEAKSETASCLISPGTGSDWQFQEPIAWGNAARLCGFALSQSSIAIPAGVLSMQLNAVMFRCRQGGSMGS